MHKCIPNAPAPHRARPGRAREAAFHALHAARGNVYGYNAGSAASMISARRPAASGATLNQYAADIATLLGA